MKKCWEGVPLLWKAKVDTYRTFLHNRNYSFIHCRQPVDGWIVQITSFLTKLPVISAKLPVACDEWRHVWTNWSFEIRGSARGFWASPAFKKWNASFEKRIRLLRKETPLLRKESDVWERSPDSSICERTLLRFLRSASLISSFYRGVNFVPQHTWAPSCKHSLLALV